MDTDRRIGLPFVRADDTGRVPDSVAVTLRPDNAGDITVRARSYEDCDGLAVQEVCIQPIDMATLRSLYILTPAGALLSVADMYDREFG